MNPRRLLVALALCAAFSAPAMGDEPIRIYLFHRAGCPACARIKPELESIASLYGEVELVAFEIGSDLASLRSFQEASRKFGIQSPAVPTVLLGDRAWTGFSDAIVAEIARSTAECMESGCIDSLSDPLPAEVSAPAITPVGTRMFGSVDPAELPLVVSTLLIALLDGFNPCSLWALTFLLGMIIHTGSRRRVIIVGAVFLTVTASVYGLFILGVVRVTSILSSIHVVKYATAILAFLFGAANLKEYVAARRSPSLSVSDADRTRFGAQVRDLLGKRESIGALAASTVLLAAGISIVELPCTAGFPVIWSNLVASSGIARIVPLFILYLLVYLVDEIAVVAVTAVTFRRITMNERRGRYLKLAGGTVMVILAGVMLVRPALLNRFGAVAGIFGISALVVVSAIGLDRRRSSRAQSKDHRRRRV